MSRSYDDSIEEARADLPYLTRVAYESGDRVPADAMRSLLRITSDLLDALETALEEIALR